MIRDNDSVFRPKSDQTKPKFTKINFVKSGKNVKSVNKENTNRQVEYPRKNQSPRDNRRNWNGMMTQKLGNGFEFIKKACFVCGSFNNLIKDYDFHDNKMVEKPVINNKGRVTVNDAKQSSPRAASLISTARPVNTTASKSKVNDALPTTYSYFKAHSPVRRAFNQKSAAKINNFNEKVNTARVNNVTTAGPKAVVIAAMGNRENAVKSSACWISRPTENVIDHNSKDSGSYMLKRYDYIDLQVMSLQILRIDGGFVAFGGVLKKNLFFFTETECLVLSPDFKLLDESQVLLRVPRQNNMYGFDLKNVVLTGGRKHDIMLHVTILVSCYNPKYLRSPSCDDAGKKNEVLDPAKEDDKSGQKEVTNTNSTNRLNTVSSSINTISSSFTTTDLGRERVQRNEFESVSIPVNAATLPNVDLPTDPLIPDLEDTGIFSGAYDNEDMGVEVDLNNFETTMNQTIVANSTTEAEYVAAANCCGQVLWIQNQMLDYGFNFMNTKIHIDNESTICIVKNPVFHSKTKHIEIRHHFIRDSYEKKLIQVIKIHTDHNVADLLTKAFDVSRKAKRTTEISQSSGPIHLDADETVYKEWQDIMERAATTTSSLETEQDS
ncbi:hypothetical protein Tco_1253046, partial [Tanacetum coccineum]